MSRRRVARGDDTGFTIIELMVTVAVVAIFSALAGPAFREMIASQRVRSGASALTESLWLARSEAVKRNANDVTFTVANGAGSSWNVMIGATTLHSQEGVSNVVWETKCPDAASTVYTFNRYGKLTSGGGTKMQLGVANTGVHRCVAVSVSGRTTVGDGTCSC